VVPLLAIVLTAAAVAVRVKRIEYVSSLNGGPAPASSGAVQAQVGSGDWQPRLIIPGHHNESFEWLDQVRQMTERRQWRVRFIDYENAQGGREVFAACPYRWWLWTAAWFDHVVTGWPMGRSLEWAALYADPILMLVFGAATVAFVALRHGALAASLVSVALAALFPFAAEFAPGTPDDVGLSLALAVWSVLPLLAGAVASVSAGSHRRSRNWFIAGGVVGGIGMWVSPQRQLPILIGIGLGALLAAWIARGRDSGRGGPADVPARLPWRPWALAGGATCLAAFLLEFFPSDMGGWELRAVHPVFGLTWVGGGELLSLLGARIAGDGGRKGGLRKAGAWVLATAAVSSLPAAVWIGHNRGLITVELPSMQVSLLPGSAEAANLWSWLLQNGFTYAVWATVLPLLILIPAIAILALGKLTTLGTRVPLALAIGPALVSIPFACRGINGWNGVDAALIAVLLATAAALKGVYKPLLKKVLIYSLAGTTLLACSFGISQIWPAAALDIRDGLTKAEVVELIERDLAYWLAKHVGSAGGVALAPPNVTTALYYYGNIRGLATFDWENRNGLQAAVRITSATTPEEAQELIGIHGVTHIIIPGWDPYMSAYAKIGGSQVEGSFLDRLYRWTLPNWLKPVVYLTPNVGGFEGQSVEIFEVVEEQDDAVALSRTAIYLADSNQLDLAAKAGEALRRFPSDLGALVARAQVETACGEGDKIPGTIELLLRRISGGADRDLPWDQRIGLAVVLTQAHHADLALPRLRQCIAELDDEKLRSLSTPLLYRFHVLRRAFKLDIPDPKLRALSHDLLPPDLRTQVEQ
jgi:hypothetical protein